MGFKDKNDINMYEIAYMFCDREIRMNSSDKLNQSIDNAIKETLLKFGDKVKDSEDLKEYLYSRVSREREEDEPVVLLGEEAGNETWWIDYRNEHKDSLIFWDRYYKYLYEEKNWERSAIKKSIDNTTDILLNSIANPLKSVAQEKRAMVVGYVQSGKTANYIGLINKALNVGYKYIIVLAGMHNNLRSQTQSRIDEEVLGYETDSEARQKQRECAEKNKIGVGKLCDAGFVQTLTFRDEKGDFSKKRSGIITSPDIATIVVTKKVKSTLENLIENIKSNTEVSIDENHNFYMKAKYPLLLIDDEADQASVNTGYDYTDDGKVIDEYDVKTINKLIRKLFKLFENRSYVGYTATPYANIFIPNDISIATEEFGNDLFPADCIISLPKPYRYIGANEFFGYGDTESIKPMPLIRRISESNFVDSKNRIVGKLPDSLKKAIKCFLISTAMRNCRGEKNKPNTMLIHVTRMKNMQRELVRKLKDYLFDELQPMIIDGDAETKQEIYELIRMDYLITTKQMHSDFSRYMEGVDEVDVDDIFAEIVRLMDDEKIRVNVINGDSRDSLAYKEHENEEYNVIAIGGDKFSRGLTLEGLSISYFTRDSKYYDTLMQMGRWFGFRPKYADLCRVFITDDIYRRFARIAFATDDLRDQIMYMCEENAKPKDFGLRVATHPELKISSPRKVKSGVMQKLDFSNTLTVTRDIDVDIEQYEDNFNSIYRLFSTASKIYSSKDHFDNLGRKSDNNHLFLENVPSYKIIEFFRTFKTSKYASKVNGNNIAAYINEQNKDGYLVEWTVCLINTGKDKPGFEIAGHKIKNGITRHGENSVVPLKNGEVCSVHMLKSKGHEYFALDRAKYEEALRIEKTSDKGKESTIAANIRSKMDRTKGLLLIYPIDHHDEDSTTKYFKIDDGRHKPPFGLVVVFPKGNGKSISYQVNSIALKENGYDIFD